MVFIVLNSGLYTWKLSKLIAKNSIHGGVFCSFIQVESMHKKGAGGKSGRAGRESWNHIWKQFLH